jgi:hypothetical protein
MGIFAMLTFLFLLVYYLVLTVFLLGQIYRSINEKFADKQRLVLIGLLTSVLTLAFLFPHGVFNFEKLESESLLVAQREGAANCMTTLKLRADNTFIERNVCFGLTETTGKYRLSGDTIYFENVSLGRHEKEFYKFAVIVDKEENEKYLGDLLGFESYSDTTGTALWIIKNEIKK